MQSTESRNRNDDNVNDFYHTVEYELYNIRTALCRKTWELYHHRYGTRIDQ